MASASKEKVAYHVKIFAKKLFILSNKNQQNCVNATNQNWVLD